MDRIIKKATFILCLFMALTLLSACVKAPPQHLTGTFHNHSPLKDENSHTEFTLTDYGEVIFSYSYRANEGGNAYNSFGPTGTFLDHNGKIIFNFDGSGFRAENEGESHLPDMNSTKELYKDALPKGRIIRYTHMQNDILYLYDNNNYRNTTGTLFTGPFHKGRLKDCGVNE